MAHFLFMMSFKLVKTTEAGLRFDQISKKLNYPRFTDRKKTWLTFRKNCMFGAAAVLPNLSQELEFDLPFKLQQLFHATLIHLMKIYFQL